MAGSPASSIRGGFPLGLAGATAATRYVGATASGAPASGTFAVGDVCVGQNGTLLICTVAGSPGTWTAVAGSTPNLAAVLAAGNSAGAKIASLTDGTLAQDATSLLQVTRGIGGILWTVVTKALDESVSSSTTMQDDDELFFTAASGSAYEFELDLVYASPAGAGTPDIKFDLGEDATVRGTFQARGIGTGEAATGTTLNTTQTSSSWGTAAANRTAFSRGVHTGGGGTFRLRWAQATSDANATIVRAGSILRYRLIV